jgi:hypothetical protein
MAIEIRELVIRARIEPSRTSSNVQPPVRQNTDARTIKNLSDDFMRILKDKRER